MYATSFANVFCVGIANFHNNIINRPFSAFVLDNLFHFLFFILCSLPSISVVYWIRSAHPKSKMNIRVIKN